jgi:prepilin-type N-terminal cleavage/methylation domain-containing protein
MPKGKAFTLIEIMVVVSIIALIAGGLALINFLRVRENTQRVLCIENRRVIEHAEIKYLAQEKRHSASFQDLVDAGYLNHLLTCKSEGIYAWMPFPENDHRYQTIVGCSVHGYVPIPLQGPYLVTTDDGVSVLNSYGRMEGSYDGPATDIIIPNVLNGFDVKYIWQDVFNGKGLTSLAFEENSNVERIHARAFRNNDLTAVDFPDGLKRIDALAFSGNKLQEITLPSGLERIETQAFSNNNINKITIGSGVTIDNNAFENNNFRDAYYAGGQGTYLLVNGVWTKPASP